MARHMVSEGPDSNSPARSWISRPPMSCRGRPHARPKIAPKWAHDGLREPAAERTLEAPRRQVRASLRLWGARLQVPGEELDFGALYVTVAAGSKAAPTTALETAKTAKTVPRTARDSSNLAPR
eukprot:8278634-Pyramimonas_sp.AAC.1